MSATMDIIVSAQDQASDVIEGIGDTAESTGSFLEDNWAKVGAATAAAGAASEGFARSQGDTNAVIGRMSSRTGEAEDSIRSMLDGMTDHTFATADAAAGMEVLSKRGVENREDFEKLLPMFDSFADATGQDMVDGIEKATRGLGAFGIPASDAGDHIDTMTFLSEQLDVEMDVMGRRLGRVAGEMSDLGLGLEDGAAGIKVFTDRGMNSRDAMNEFRDAVKDSDGDMDQLLDNLGLTADEWEAYQEEIDGAAGMTDEFAEINNSTMTPIERMQANVENLMTKYGGLADAAGIAAPVLMSMGPAMKGVSMASKGLSSAMTFLAANPIVLVIAAVAALATGLVLLWKNSETFRDIVTGVFEAVADAGRWMWENVLQPVWEAIQGGFDVLMTVAQAYWDAWSLVFEAAAEVVEWMWESIVEPVWEAIQGGFEVLMTVAGAYRDFWVAVFERAAEIVVWVWENVLSPTWDLVRGGLDLIVAVAGKFRDHWAGIFEKVGSIAKGVWDNVISPAWDALVGGLDWVGDKAGELADMWGAAMEGIQDGARAIVNPIIGFFNTLIGGVESLVNGIASGVNRIPSITIPNIPGVPGRGETVSLPTIPTVSIGRIPRLAEGGIVRARTGGTLAQIAEGGQDEAVTPLGPNDPFGHLLDELRAVRRLLERGEVLEVDGEVLARAARRHGRRQADRTGAVVLA